MSVIDTDEVRSALVPRAVLEHYGWKFKKSGDELESTACPARGDHSRRALLVNATTGRWQCFPCSTSGDLFDFIAALEAKNVATEFRAVVEKAAEIAGVGPSHLSADERRQRATEYARRRSQEEADEARLKAARDAAAVPIATNHWNALATKSSAGFDYLCERRIGDAILVSDLVRYDLEHGGSPSVRLFTLDGGETCNVVSRRLPALGEPKTPGLFACPTVGSLAGRVADIDKGKDVVVTEGVIDSVTACLVWPKAIVLGAHGSGNLAKVVAAAATTASRTGSRVAIVPHQDKAGYDAALAACLAAHSAGLEMRLGTLVLVDHGHKDLNEAWQDGWRPGADVESVGGEFSVSRLRREIAAIESAKTGTSIQTHTGTFASSPDRLRGELDERIGLAARALKFHHAFLDDCLRALLPNDLVLLGAPTGLGKTDLAMNIATTNAFTGKRVHYFALEAEPRELERRTKFAMLSKLAFQESHSKRRELNYTDWLLGKCEHICGHNNADVDARIARDLRPFWTFYRGNKFDAKDLEKQIIAVHQSTDLIVIDHLHYIDHGADEHEVSALGNMVKTIRDVALNVGKPVLLIAHLRKREQGSKRLIASIDDFHGSSNITKICTQAITIERCNVVDTGKWHQAPTFMTILKDRRAGALPFVAVTNFDRRTKSYASNYTLGRLTKGGADWEQISPGDKPEWAVHHVPLAVKEAPAVAVQEGWRQ